MIFEDLDLSLYAKLKENIYICLLSQLKYQELWGYKMLKRCKKFEGEKKQYNENFLYTMLDSELTLASQE